MANEGNRPLNKVTAPHTYARLEKRAHERRQGSGWAGVQYDDPLPPLRAPINNNNVLTPYPCSGRSPLRGAGTTCLRKNAQ
eukprot:scaffold49376_cov32-Tisochrysis_lutea.AAC.2